MTKHKIVLVAFIVATWPIGMSVAAPWPYEPGVYYKVIASPQNRAYAVQSVTDWSISKRADGTNEFRIKGRFQVYHTSNSVPVWRIEQILLEPDDAAILSDDGAMLVKMCPAFSMTAAVNSVFTTNALPANKEVIVFFNKGEKIKSYSLESLEFDLKSRASGGDAPLTAILDPYVHLSWSWAYPSVDRPLGNNPIVWGDFFTLTMTDNKVRAFRISTAKLLGVVPITNDPEAMRVDLRKIAPGMFRKAEK